MGLSCCTFGRAVIDDVDGTLVSIADARGLGTIVASFAGPKSSSSNGSKGLNAVMRANAPDCQKL